MKTYQLLLGFLFAVLALAGIFGCGTATTGASGYGADAGPWPQAPARSTPGGANPSASQVPDVPIVVLLRGKAAENQQLDLEVTQVDLKFESQWVPVANRDAIAKNESLPLHMTQKGIIAMLATPKTKVPQRKYTHLRLRFDDRKTKLAQGDKKVPLTLQATLDLGEWTPDDKTINLLTVTVDGTKVKATDSSATLPTEAVTVAKGTTTAGVTGKIVPAAPTARVDAFWGSSKVLIGTAVPTAQDGAFQITNLPAGSYRLEITNPGFHPADEKKNIVSVEDKVVALGDMQLVKDGETK